MIRCNQQIPQVLIASEPFDQTVNVDPEAAEHCGRLPCVELVGLDGAVASTDDGSVTVWDDGALTATLTVPPEVTAELLPDVQYALEAEFAKGIRVTLAEVVCRWTEASAAWWDREAEESLLDLADEANGTQWYWDHADAGVPVLPNPEGPTTPSARPTTRPARH